MDRKADRHSAIELIRRKIALAANKYYNDPVLQDHSRSLPQLTIRSVVHPNTSIHAGLLKHVPGSESELNFDATPKEDGDLTGSNWSFVKLRKPDSRNQLDIHHHSTSYETSGLTSSRLAYGLAADTDISNGKLLGRGSFGEVYLTEMDTLPVVVKVPSSPFENYNREMDLIDNIGQHPCVVGYYGRCPVRYKGKTVIGLVMPYYSRGSLHKWLKRKRTSDNPNAIQGMDLSDGVSLSWWNFGKDEVFHDELLQLCSFARDIAAGVAFLHRQSIIHRDLAARNILLSDRQSTHNGLLRAVVTDFGFSIVSRAGPEGHMGSVTSGSTIISARWAAPEVLKVGMYSCTSDSWSYGVLLWEMLTGGTVPYKVEKIGEAREIYEFLTKGNRLETPAQTPDYFRKILNSCWKFRPKERQSMESILDIIKPLRSVPAYKNL